MLQLLLHCLPLVQRGGSAAGSVFTVSASKDPFALQVLNGGRTLTGQMYRMTTCEITYGPLNCDFVFRADNE